MKKFLLIWLLFTAVIMCAIAQQLPNPGFETFEKDDLNGVGYTPTGWNAANVKKTVAGVTAQKELVSEDANGRSGKCVRIHNEEVGAAGITAAAPSWITLGRPWNALKPGSLNKDAATAGTDGGINFKYRPDTLAVWIRRVYNVRENAHIVFYSWKGTARGSKYKMATGDCLGIDHTDEESDIRQLMDKNSCGTDVYATQIADGQWRSDAQYQDWTEIKVPITYMSNDVPEKMNVIISSGNYPNYRSTAVYAGSQLWADDVRFIYSSAIHELGLGKGVTIRGFAPDKLEYTYALGNKPIPAVSDITLKRSGRTLASSEYTIVPATALGETMTITVKAEDGSSNTTYKVTFIGEVSKNPRPQSILVGGEPIKGFVPEVTKYDVVLPFGTTSCPDITIVAADEGQTIANVVKPSSLPGEAKVSVMAADGATTQEYILNLSVGAFDNATLTGININGKPIKNFDPNKTTYVVELPTGTTAAPKIEFTTDYPQYQTIVVKTDGINGATVSVTPQGSSKTNIYRITYVITESTYSYLDMITIDGNPVAGFAPDKFDYEYRLPLGTVEMPKVNYVKGNEFQTVNVELGGLDGITRITVVAQSGKQSLYKINFKTEKSSVSTLSGISVNGVPVADFSPEKKDYSVELPVGTVTAPVVTYIKGDAGQTVTVNSGGLNGKTYIVVKAQDGSSTTYTLTFTVYVSDNSRLEDILLDNVSLAGFAPDRTEYDIPLDRGTQKLPEITYKKGDPTQAVTKIENGVNGTTRITVKAQSGAVTVYLLNFSVETNSNVTLTNIYIGGTALDGFESGKTAYEVELPSGTTEVPEITFDKGDAAQSVMIMSGGVNGITKIVVRAEDGTEGIYTVTFSVMKSENAFLQMIYIGGEPLRDFDKERMEYDFTIPDDYIACPTVTVDKEPGQQVMISSPRKTGIVSIRVTPESGSGNVYTIDVHYHRSTNDKLMDLMVDGSSVTGFSPDINEYDYVLPRDAKELPVIEYTVADETQTVYIEYGGLESDTKVSVRAEDGRVNVYTIRFSLEKSDNAALSGISLGGVELPDFSPDKYDYKYTLPVNVTEAPVLTYTKSAVNQQVTASVPAFEGLISIDVVSEDRSDTAYYTIELSKAVSSNTELSRIMLNGTTVAAEAFVDGVATFNWVMSDGAPQVTYETSDAYQTVAIADAGVNGIDILVIAEDGSSRRYALRFELFKSSVATLSGLQIFNSETREYESMPDFDPSVYEYDIILPRLSEFVPNLYPVAGSVGQTIDIAYGGVNGSTIIEVLSEDKHNTQTYKLNFSTEKSSDATLKGIYADGEFISDFSENKFTYTVMVEPDTEVMPILTWDVSTGGQTVVYKTGTLFSPSTITVIAEDGESSNTYTVNFEFELSGKPNTLRSIAVGDVVVAVEDGKTEYDIMLPYGTADMSVRVIKQSEHEQRVVIMNNGIGTQSKVDVYMGEQKTSYLLNVSVDDVNPVALISLAVNGVDVDVNSVDSVYIVNVAEVPVAESITFTARDGVEMEVKSINAAQAVLETYTTVSDIVKHYTLYFHYSDDVIPNADFSDWRNADINGSAPVGWRVPGDCDDSFKAALGTTYTTGHEVQNEGSGVVKLVTTGAWNSIAGAVPGMMTVGTMALELKSTGKSTSSVSGGIVYRNSPDKIMLDYKPVSNTRIGNWRMLMSLSQAGSAKELLYTGSFDNKNEWSTAVQSIDYSGFEYIDAINITINSANTENASNLGFTLNNDKNSELHVRNLRFYFDNLLSDIKVDGVTVTGFDPERYEYIVGLDDDYQGTPVIEVTGRVRDQQHRVVWESERKAVVTSMAEDGTEAVYTLEFARHMSENTDLKTIKVNGVPLKDFDPSVTEYTYMADKPFDRIPDISVVLGSVYQNVVCSVEDKYKVNIMVIAENYATKRYTVNFRTAKDNNTALAGLTVDGYDGLVFDPAVKEYSVVLSDGQELLPMIRPVRSSELQTVVMTVADKTEIAVTAADSVTTDIYTVEFIRPMAPASSVLAELGGVSDFAADKFGYEHHVSDNGSLKPTFRPQSITDTVTQHFSDDLLSISVKGDSVNTYSVRMLYNLNSSASLADLQNNSNTLQGFMPELHDYSLVLNRGKYPALRAVVDNNATLSLGYELSDNGDRVISFGALSEDKSATSTTTVTMMENRSSAASLAGIYLNGAMLVAEGEGYKASVDFSSEITEYTVTMLAGHPKLKQQDMPDIFAVAGGDYQNVTIFKGGFENPTVITVTPDDGIETIYVLNIRRELSSNTSLVDLALDHSTVAGFDPEVTEYGYKTETAGYIPAVTYQTADAYQTVDVQTSPSEITVTVRAEDGSEQVYRIAINANVSNNAYLSNIILDGIQLPGFSFNKFDYQVTLPVGTEVTPEISVVAGDDGQVVSITDGGVNGTTVIRVKATDGITEKVYRINYKVTLSTNNELENIYIGTEPLADFYPAKRSYVVQLPVGVEVNPAVYPVKGDAYQTIGTKIVANGTVIITVTPQNAAYEAIYTIRFEANLSENALLGSLDVAGTPVSGFSPDKYDYVYDLPIGTETLPEISWVAGDKWQEVILTPTGKLNGRASIEVIAQNRKFRSLYTIRFNPLLSENDTLGVILIDGTPLNGFSPNVFEYDVELPAGTKVLPEISVEKGDKYQSVDVVSGGVNGQYVITVTSQSGKINRYVINFSVELSHNSHLAAIIFSKDVIENFDPEIFYYELPLPYGTQELPLLFYELAEPSLQTAEYIFAKTVSDTARIIVTAQDGVTKSEYRISFKQEKSNNASLAEIRIGGEVISTYARAFKSDKDFMPDTYIYNIEFPYGTDSIPEITYTGQVADYSSVVTEIDTLSLTAVITVTSQDKMNVNEYVLKFAFLRSDNAFLKSISLDGKMIDGFEPTVTDYTIIYPIGTDTASLPDVSSISYELMEDGQSVDVTQNVPEEIVIVVTAHDGVTINVYTVRFEITLSDNTLLRDILVDGVSLANFYPTWPEYTYMLFPGAAVPGLVGVKDEDSQNITVQMGMVNEPSYIYVEAEDGTIGEYIIHFNTTDINPGTKPSMDDVAWIPLGNGDFMASSLRSNVTVRVYQTDGLLVTSADAGLVDPNENIKQNHTGGTVLHFDRRGQTYIYAFIYDNQVVFSGKFVY